jgi:hypothetical protein
MIAYPHTAALHASAATGSKLPFFAIIDNSIEQFIHA